MCAIKNGDEIRCDFPSQLCPLVIYLVEKSSRFGSIRALVVPLLVVNRALYPARTSLGALLRIGVAKKDESRLRTHPHKPRLDSRIFRVRAVCVAGVRMARAGGETDVWSSCRSRGSAGRPVVPLSAPFQFCVKGAGRTPTSSGASPAWTPAGLAPLGVPAPRPLSETRAPPLKLVPPAPLRSDARGILFGRSGGRDLGSRISDPLKIFGVGVVVGAPLSSS